jgi:small subunit ribosomal protein S17
MAEEDKNEQEAPATEPEAESQAAAPAEEAPAAEAEAPAEEPAAEAAPEPEPEAAPAPAADASGDDAEPAEVLGPKEKRRLARSAHAGEAGPSRTVEERAADRVTERKRKAAGRTRRRATERKKKGESQPGTPPAERPPGPQKIREGIVTSSKADKTITVQIQSARRHPQYEKIIRRSKSLHAHDEKNEAGQGDTVRVIETRPMSKSKRWRLVEVVEKAR